MTLAAKKDCHAEAVLVTAEELLRLGKNFHGELLRGKLITMSPAGSQHGMIAMAIGSRISVFVEDNNLGCTYAAETGFVLSRNPDTVRAPDVAFVAAARLPSGGNSVGFFEGAPDLAVEVLSPSNTNAEMVEKIADYLKAGTRLIWIIDPARNSVTVHDAKKQDPIILQPTDTLVGEDVLPGFRLLISTILK